MIRYLGASFIAGLQPDAGEGAGSLERSAEVKVKFSHRRAVRHSAISSTIPGVTRDLDAFDRPSAAGKKRIPQIIGIVVAGKQCSVRHDAGAFIADGIALQPAKPLR